ncbi:carbon-nitrogen hydrolase family protein [Ferrimonas pelagia]|uniref:Carbon-nitrogen hydrolase family protein n=1 Tax=Ferrimonas pelagia TaxID=1177826 RepID=A0ABP9FGR3_9GAMM
MQIHLLQLNSQGEPSHNLSRIRERLSPLAAATTPQLVILPEACLHMASGNWAAQAEVEGGPWQTALAQLAGELGLYLLAGTLPVQAEDGRAYAASLLYGPQGQLLGRYDKIHLFDARVGDGQRYRESRDTCPGEQAVVIDTPFGRLGLAVCYDVRFPALFQRLAEAGAELIALPSAFTQKTGQAHWQVLVRARAIETQCFVLAANQWGQHADGRRTWGQSMVVDPWGRLLAQQNEGEGLISVKLDPQLISQARAAIPVQQHQRAIDAALLIPNKTEGA